MNYVFLFGNMGSPAKYSINQAGVPSARWSLAVRPRRGKVINWVQCVCYGALADIIRENYGTGDSMLIKDGELHITKYGEDRPYWQVRVRLIEHLGRVFRDNSNISDEEISNE